MSGEIVADQGTTPIRRVVVVGGGSAGWITAGLLAAEHSELSICLIESPSVPIIGVGEGTWPSMRRTLQRLGLSEADFVHDCDASFKQGTWFRDWSSQGDSGYLHPFSLPTEFSSLNLANYWLMLEQSGAFADFVTPQADVVRASLAPKQCDTPDFAFNVNYGYHFDAGKFAQVLKRHVTENLGVEYVSAHITGVERSEDGDIARLILDDGALVGDLFVDCSGQQSLLLGQQMGVALVAADNVLFNDRALAVQVPYENPETMIASTTHSTAQEAGWIWDIGLQSRRGLGYVHSAAHTTPEQAYTALSQYIERTSPAINIESLSFRELKFVPGYRKTFWDRNCVAVGLSAGFIEPLEASALALVEQSANILSDHFPSTRQIMDVVSKRFNEKMHYHWQSIIEFLKLHYVLSQRQDSEYWADNRNPNSCPESLTEKLLLWQQQAPWHDDAPRIDELFPSASYQYVLYGMRQQKNHGRQSSSRLARDLAKAQGAVKMTRERGSQLRAALPSNRDLIRSMSERAGNAA